MLALTESADIDPALLEPPINIMRLGLHPRGLGPLFVNVHNWHAHWLKRLERQLAATGDEQLAALIDEVAGYYPPEPEPGVVSEIAGSEMLGPVKVRTPDGGELSFFGMFASFDTPFEVTSSEMAIELLFPADRATAETLHGRGRDLARTSPRTRDQGEARRPGRSPSSDNRSPARGACY